MAYVKGHDRMSEVTVMFASCGVFGFFFFLFSFPWHVEIPRLGVEWELQLLACTGVMAERDLSHWARPGIELTSSRTLVGFVSAVPQQELLVVVL